MIALKKAPAGVPDQARANLKTHYYDTISDIVFSLLIMSFVYPEFLPFKHGERNYSSAGAVV